MSIEDVRNAIANAVTSTGLKTTPYLTDQVNVPQGCVGGPDITYHGSFDGEATYLFFVRVYVARDAVSAQKYVDTISEPTGASSVPYAIENDTALADLVYSATVSRRSPIDQAIVGETPYLAADFTVTVIL